MSPISLETAAGLCKCTGVGESNQETDRPGRILFLPKTINFSLRKNRAIAAPFATVGLPTNRIAQPQ